MLIEWEWQKTAATQVQGTRRVTTPDAAPGKLHPAIEPAHRAVFQADPSAYQHYLAAGGRQANQKMVDAATYLHHAGEARGPVGRASARTAARQGDTHMSRHGDRAFSGMPSRGDRLPGHAGRGAFLEGMVADPATMGHAKVSPEQARDKLRQAKGRPDTPAASKAPGASPGSTTTSTTTSTATRWPAWAVPAAVGGLALAPSVAGMFDEGDARRKKKRRA